MATVDVSRLAGHRATDALAISSPPQLRFWVVDLVKDPTATGSLARSTNTYPKTKLTWTITQLVYSTVAAR